MVKKHTSRDANGSLSSGFQATPDNYQESVTESLSMEADNQQAQTADTLEITEDNSASRSILLLSRRSVIATPLTLGIDHNYSYRKQCEGFG